MFGSFPQIDMPLKLSLRGSLKFILIFCYFRSVLLYMSFNIAFANKVMIPVEKQKVPH